MARRNVSQGDGYIVNDQLTTPKPVSGGYPIVGHDSGLCTVTRVETATHDTLENCVVTADLPRGDLAVEGMVPATSGLPEPAQLAVTGGTGAYADAAGVVRVSFTPNYEIFTIELS